jgi:hypothetical protein
LKKSTAAGSSSRFAMGEILGCPTRAYPPNKFTTKMVPSGSQENTVAEIRD